MIAKGSSFPRSLLKGNANDAEQRCSPLAGRKNSIARTVVKRWGFAVAAENPYGNN